MSESISFLMVFRGGELSLSRLLKIMKKDNKVRITFNHRAYKAQNIDNPLKTSSSIWHNFYKTGISELNDENKLKLVAKI